MSTSPATPFLSEIESVSPIPEAKLAYLEQRVLNSFYGFVVGKFLEQKESSSLTQAMLARRINRGTDVVNRWLASPSNWQIGTLARLLVGISGEEAVLSSSPLVGRAPRNQTVADLLADDENVIPVRSNFGTESDTDSVSIKIERI